MKKLMFVGLIIFLISSCSSSHSSADSDIIPDSDSDNSENIIDEDTDSEEDFDFIDDSEEKSDQDSDSDIEDTEEPDDGIFEETAPINGYARCYDKIPAGDYEGLFADQNVESQIKKSLGYEEDYELTQEDLEKIKEISVSFKDLRGFEKLVNLEYVKFQDTEGNIYDFTPLSNLKKLKKIRIYFRPLAELDPSEHHENMTCLDGSFSLLTTLEALEMENTHLKEVAPIELLVNLNTLEIDHNKIESLPKNIGNLQKLELLTFSYNNVKELNPLISLTNLKSLAFTNNQVEDISPLKNMTKMTIINFSQNNVKDISAIENLSELESLGVDTNKIERLPDFHLLGKLQYIYLSFNNISDLPNMKGLDSLDEMKLAYNNLSDEEFVKLDELEHVEVLIVGGNKKITKVPVMKNLKSLKELYLNYNSITDLSGFADNESFPALKSVYLGSNKISDAEALRERKGLNRLSIGKNCIQDLSPLEELNERGTYISGMNDQLENCEDK